MRFELKNQSLGLAKIFKTERAPLTVVAGMGGEQPPRNRVGLGMEDGVCCI